MIIDNNLLNQLLAQANENPRLRQNLDLRTSNEDTSQRMLNALLPGTLVPIHRHRETTETVVLLKGSVEEVFYDNNGVECARYTLSHESGNIAIQVPKGQWHTIVAKEQSVIFEAKDGSFIPTTDEDILKI